MMNTLSKIKTFWRNWSYKTFSPSNVLRIRNVEKYWVDRDQRFFHAAFTILMDFVDYEMGGEQGLERYVQQLSQQTQFQGVRDVEIQEFQKIFNEHTRMLELYRWYSGVNWDNPVPESPKYLELLQKVEIKTEPTDHGTYKITTVGSENKELTQHRIAHAAREQEFEQTKMQKLIQLCSIYPCLWN